MVSREQHAKENSPAIFLRKQSVNIYVHQFL